MQTRKVASSWRRTTGWASPMVTGRIRFGSTVVIVRRIHSAIRRFEFERSGLDTYLALAGCRRERALPRNKPGNGVAARRFGWIDGKEFACPGSRALAANGRPPARDAPDDLSLRAVGYPRRMAALDTDRRQPACHRVRYLPASRPAPSTGIDADTTDATGALVVRRSDRARCRFDARADLSWTLPASRPRQKPRGSRDPHKRQSRDGRAGLRRPRHGDDRCWRMFRMARLPLSWSKIRIAELVQSR